MAVDEQENDPNSVLDVFRRLVAWRKKQPALVRGDFVMAESTDRVLAFERVQDGEHVLCVFNFSNRETLQRIPGAWRSIADQDFGAALEREQLVLPPFGVWFGEPA